MADMYKDFEKEGSSERAKIYHIRQWKEPLKMASFDRIEDMPVDGGFFFEKLPDFNGFPIFVCYNYNEDDEFLIYVMKHGLILTIVFKSMLSVRIMTQKKTSLSSLMALFTLKQPKERKLKSSFFASTSKEISIC